jgi:hypothetical protein
MIAKNRASMMLVIAVLALGTGMTYAQQQAQPQAQQQAQPQVQPQVQPQAQQQDEGPILQPKPKPKPVVQSTLQVTCDLACKWTLDGTAKGNIAAGATVNAKVSPGQHTVAAATEDALDKAENVVKVKLGGQTVAHIWLKPVHDARLKAEQEAKDKADQDAKDKAMQEARDKASQEAQAKAEQEKRDKDLKEAQAKADQDAKDKAFIEARDKASQEAQAKAEQEAHDKAVREEWDKEQREHGQVAQPDNSGGVWSDPATGLMWTRKDNGYALRWQPAAEYCRNLQLGGYSDWRLPTIDELKNLYNPAARTACGAYGNSVCQIKGKIQLTSGVVWSSSSGGRPQFMRGFYFRGAGEPRTHVLELDRRGANYDRALCVRRSGQ